MTFSRPPVAVVVMQHAEEAAMLRHVRSVLVRAPHVKLHQLGRLDERIAAHLDGLAVAGDYGWSLLETALANPGVGEMFAATVLAIERRDADALDKMLAIAEALPEARRGLASAFGWVSANTLRGITRALLDSPRTFQGQVGLCACALHGVDPGRTLDAALADADTALRRCALRAAGGLGRLDLLPVCQQLLADAELRFDAARAALLLGERGASVGVLQDLALDRDQPDDLSLGLLLKVSSQAQTRSLLSALANDKRHVRHLIRGIGIGGDAHYVPWLIQQMADLPLSRLAGEAFSLITGLDLANLDLERKPPEGVDFGPNDDPEDPDVAMDEDDSLPWPDPVRITAWWQANGARFQSGVRHFMGESPTTAHGLSVLRTGFQRQRAAAAEYLCLLNPGTPLFNVAAPTRRQQRALATP
jgi:uncharacterized protein (TIGR02270 family)